MNINQLKQDLDFFFQTIEEVHPKLDFYTSETKLAEQKSEAYTSLENAPSKQTLVSVINEYLGLVNDDHTRIQNSSVVSILAPFQAIQIESKPIISKVFEYKDGRVNEFEIGDIILAINNIPIDRVIKEKMVQQPGSVYWSRTRVIEDLHRFTKGKSRKAVFTVSKASGKVVDVSIFLVPRGKLRREKPSYRHLTEPFIYEINEEEGFGVFTYKACTDRDRTKQWGEKYLERLAQVGIDINDIPDMEETCWDFFSEMKDKNLKHMILDIRGNAGGNSNVGQIMYKYLTNKDLETYRVKTKISKQLQEQDEWYAKKKRGVFYSRKYRLLKSPYNSRLSKDQLKKIPKFEGELYVLINNKVFSSGEWIAAELRANEIGTFIGEPTGGGGSRPGDTLYFDLPHTGIKFSCSYKLFEMPGDYGFPGVIPHYLVRQTIKDFRQGKDTALEFTKGLIKNTA